MKKNDYITEIAERSNIAKKDIKIVLDAIQDTVNAHLLAGDEVPVLDGLKLTTIQKAARMGRNPATGEAVAIPAKTAPKAKFGKALKAIFA